MGAESLAKLVKCPVFYLSCTKVKRGHYEVELIPIDVPPYAKDDHSILDNYVYAVEKVIQENPSEWSGRTNVGSTPKRKTTNCISKL